MFANQSIFDKKDERSKPEDATDAVRPASKPPSQGIMAGFSLQNNQNMKYTYKGAVNHTSPPIPTLGHSLRKCLNNDFTSFYDLSIYSSYRRRHDTFKSWPKSHPIHPENLCRAGFLYTGEGDKVLCPWCKLMLIEWEVYDLPFEEHRRHSPYCSYLDMVMP